MLTVKADGSFALARRCLFGPGSAGLSFLPRAAGQDAFCLTMKLLDNLLYVPNGVLVAVRGLVRRGASGCRRGMRTGLARLKKRVARALFDAGVSAQ